jgi:hypothetical protein
MATIELTDVAIARLVAGSDSQREQQEFEVAKDLEKPFACG